MDTAGASLRSRIEVGRVVYVAQRHLSVLDALHHAQHRRAWPTACCSSLHCHDTAFHGTPDRETAFRLARLGWREGRDLLARARAQMPRASAPVRILEWDVAGAYPDPARAAAGVPDCMVACGGSVTRPAQVIRVVVSLTTPWTTTLPEFINRGAAIMSAVEAAELAGYPVQVEVEETVHVAEMGFTASIVIKDAGHPADRDSLAFFLIHPSALRRVFFALLETEPDLLHFQYGYGHPIGQPSALRQPGDIYLPNFQTGDFSSAKAAFDLVQVLFRQSGCAVDFPDSHLT